MKLYYKVKNLQCYKYFKCILNAISILFFNTVNKNIFIPGLNLNNLVSITSSDTSTPFTIGNHNAELKDLNFIPVNNAQAKAIINNGNLRLININVTAQLPGSTPSLLNNGTLDISGLIAIK